jgi:hypothetical protein
LSPPFHQLVVVFINVRNKAFGGEGISSILGRSRRHPIEKVGERCKNLTDAGATASRLSTLMPA